MKVYFESHISPSAELILLLMSTAAEVGSKVLNAISLNVHSLSIEEYNRT